MLSKIQDRSKYLLDQADQVLKTERQVQHGTNRVDEVLFHQWRGETLSFLSQVFGENHTYYREYKEHCSTANIAEARRGAAYLKAANAELESGFLKRIDSIVSADVFSDFLEMAAHLLEQGYKDPAASLIGAVLEDGLRRIARAKDVRIKDSDDLSTLSNKLADAEIYNRLTHKRLKVWSDVRNAADHGKFNEYDQAVVLEMHRGVQDFLGQYL